MITENSESKNKEYLEEIARYEDLPVSACTKDQAKRLLKKFKNKVFFSFWEEPVEEYFPAITVGVMKLSERLYSHDKALEYGKMLIQEMSVKKLAKAYLYGVAHSEPEYCAALAAYYYFKNLPAHSFTPKYLGNNGKDVYSKSCCEICKYDSEPADEPKMQFWHVNISMSWFYINGSIPFSFNLNEAILFLEEFQKLPPVETSIEDYYYFLEIMNLIDSLPENITSGRLRDELKHSGLLKLTKDQIAAFIDMLGYLNILHTSDCFGVTKQHICERDMLPPLSDRTYYAYPVYRWTGKYGVDRESIQELFEGCY